MIYNKKQEHSEETGCSLIFFSVADFVNLGAERHKRKLCEFKELLAERDADYCYTAMQTCKEQLKSADKSVK